MILKGGSSMVEMMARLHPLAAMKAAPGPELGKLGAMGRFSLRLPMEAPAGPFAALGLKLPVQACRAAQSDTAAALWLGPGEWLLLLAEDDRARVEQALRAELAGVDYSLVDISQ